MGIHVRVCGRLYCHSIPGAVGGDGGMRVTPHLLGLIWGKARADCNGDYSDARIERVFDNVLRKDDMIRLAKQLRDGGALDLSEPPCHYQTTTSGF